MTNFFNELKRRNVVRVGIAYVVLGWVVLQVGDVLFDMFGTPDWVGKTLAAVLLLGFPFACLFAWAFELTPEGIKKTKEVDLSDSLTHSTGRKLDFVIIAALVVALGYFIWERQGLVDADQVATSSGEVDRSIAVLPFVNMSSDQEQEWFADGLTEEILNALARTPDLLVASRTSSFQYKNQNTDISEIARQLGVAHVLEGSVRRGGERLRVTAQLIRASDGFHLWSETFDRSPEDVIAIQEDVAFEIANALETAMDPEALKRMVSAGTASVAAFEAYLEGMVYESSVGSSGNIDQWPKAHELFVKARSLDPSFGLAWYHEAIYWQNQLSVTSIGSDASGMTGDAAHSYFTTAIDKAIQTASTADRAIFYSGFKATTDLRFREAVTLNREYVEKYPNSTEGLEQLISSVASIRDTELARLYVDRLLEISHDDPILLNSLINNLLFLGLVEDAVKLADDVVDRYPQHMFLLYQAHRTYLWAGRNDDARRLVQALRRGQFPPENLHLVDLRQACAEGDVVAAEALVPLLLASRDSTDVSIHYITRQLMNKPDEAHRYLVEADLGLYELVSFLTYPYFDHTYFPELVARLENQGVDRPFISGPPYACKAN